MLIVIVGVLGLKPAIFIYFVFDSSVLFSSASHFTLSCESLENILEFHFDLSIEVFKVHFFAQNI